MKQETETVQEQVEESQLDNKNIETSQTEFCEEIVKCTGKQKLESVKVFCATDRRRMNGITDELQLQLSSLQDLFGDKIVDIEKLSIQLLSQELLDQYKQNKYNSIATAIAIHAVRLLCLPITIKKIIEHLDAQDKQVKRILSYLQTQTPVSLKDQVRSFLNQYTKQLELDNNFVNVCQLILQILDMKQLISGEHEHVVAATIIKIGSDVVFYDRGGISLHLIARTAKCSDFSIKNLLNKVDEQMVAKQLLQYYNIKV